MSYEPRGRMVEFIAALKAQPTRLFTVKEAADLLGCKAYPSTIATYTGKAIANAAMHHSCVRGEWLYCIGEITDAIIVASGRAGRDSTIGIRTMASPPYSEDERANATAHPRAPGPIGYRPPSMVAPRSGSDIKIPKFSVTQIPPPPPPPVLAPAAAAPPVAAPAPAPEPPPVEVEVPVPELREQEIVGDASAATGQEAEVDNFTAAHWLDGDLVIYGAVETEDGGILINKAQLAKLKRLIAWSAL